MITGNYPSDVLTLLVWMVGVLGTAVVLESIFFARKFMQKQEEMARNTQRGFSDLRALMESEVRTLKDLFHGIDKRVIRLEERSHFRRGDTEND